MPFTFKPLWKLLIDKNITRDKLRLDLGISPATMAKMSKGRYVSLQVLDRICEYFKCSIEDVIEYVPSKNGNMDGDL